LNVGMPQVFVRTTGCNLRCSWCDTKYAFDEGKEMSLVEVLAEIRKCAYAHVCRAICITGGEPLIQSEITDLIRALKKETFWIQLQTNGTIKNVDAFELCDVVSMDMKPPSSGMRSNHDLIPYAKEIKVVIANEQDLEYAMSIRMLMPWFQPLILQPEGFTTLDVLPLLEQAARIGLTFTNVRVLPQVHKLLWGLKRGV